MKKNRMARTALDCTSVLASPCAVTARAQISDDVVRIGFITDISGFDADVDGLGGVEAITMAISDFGGTVNGKKIEFVYADHQNKTDIAASKARGWIDEDRVDMLIGGTHSAAALATNKVVAASRPSCCRRSRRRRRS